MFLHLGFLHLITVRVQHFLLKVCRCKTQCGWLNVNVASKVQQNIPFLTNPLWTTLVDVVPQKSCVRVRVADECISNLFVPNVSRAINVWLDQKLRQQSETISGQGILIGRIHRLYLHSPSSLNCTIDLGLGHWGLAQRWVVRWGEVDGREGQRRKRIRTQRERLPLGASSAAFSLFSIWPWSWLYCSIQRPYFEHLVNICQ